MKFSYTNENDYELPEFIQEEAEKDINRVFDKGVKNVKLYQIDELVKKYGVGNPLLIKKLKPIINLEDSQRDFYYGHKYQKEKKHNVVVKIISDNKKYQPINVNIDVLTIVGEVKWKSSFVEDLSDKNFYEPTNSDYLFKEKNKIPTIGELDIFFNQNKKGNCLMEEYTVYLDAETTAGSHINADLLSYSAILVRDKDLKVVDNIEAYLQDQEYPDATKLMHFL